MASSSDADKKSKPDRAGLPFEPKSARKGAAKDKADSDAKAKRDSIKQSAKKSSAKKSAKKGGKAAGKSGVSASAQAQVDEIRAMNRRKSEKFLAEKAEAEKSGGRVVSSSRRADSNGAIPEAVSRRMLRRMAILSGSPVVLGVGIFFLAYYLRSHEIVEFAPIVVLLSTMGCFGLGVLGLTYGVLSASWDSEPGSLVGLEEFKLNFGRVMDARRASKT
ncbi:MAG: PAM68 family protein [Cyanobacteria bacterium J06598_3]